MFRYDNLQIIIFLFESTKKSNIFECQIFMDQHRFKFESKNKEASSHTEKKLASKLDRFSTYKLYFSLIKRSNVVYKESFHTENETIAIFHGERSCNFFHRQQKLK